MHDGSQGWVFIGSNVLFLMATVVVILTLILDVCVYKVNTVLKISVW